MLPFHHESIKHLLGTQPTADHSWCLLIPLQERTHWPQKCAFLKVIDLHITQSFSQISCGFFYHFFETVTYFCALSIHHVVDPLIPMYLQFVVRGNCTNCPAPLQEHSCEAWYSSDFKSDFLFLGAPRG